MICKKCGFDCYENEIVCPICQEIIVNSNSNNKENKVLLNNKDKTNKFFMVSLSLLFSLGVAFIILFGALEYRNNRKGIYDFTIRQFILIIVVLLNKSIILEKPFLKSNNMFERKNKVINQDKKRYSEIIYYAVFLGICILFWHIFYGGFIQNDMIYYFSNKSMKYNLENRFSVYTYLYHLGFLFCYLPYLIYYYFEMNFEYDDLKRYYNFFGFVIIVPLIVILYILG